MRSKEKPGGARKNQGGPAKARRSQAGPEDQDPG